MLRYGFVAGLGTSGRAETPDATVADSDLWSRGEPQRGAGMRRMPTPNIDATPARARAALVTAVVLLLGIGAITAPDSPASSAAIGRSRT